MASWGTGEPRVAVTVPAPVDGNHPVACGEPLDHHHVAAVEAPAEAVTSNGTTRLLCWAR
jgi:hypothetical protein